MKIITTCLGVLLSAGLAVAQQEKTISETIAFEQLSDKNVFYLANINGSISAEAYDGDKVLVEAKRKIYAKTDSRLQKALEELSLGIIDRVDTVIVYIKGPCAHFGKGNREYRKKTGWNYNWNDCKYDYDFSFDFTLKVPRNLNVYLSTVNKGDIKIKGVKGSLGAHNINGSISLDGVSSKVYAYTINGDVKVNYADISTIKPSYFYTLNGDIEANYPKGLKADVAFKSYNGDLYTNIDEIEYRPNVVKDQSVEGSEGVSFKVETKSLISVRGGGILLDFETFNGDVYVREN